MIEFNYLLFDSYTALKTRQILTTRKNSILGNSSTTRLSNIDRQSIRLIEVILKDYVINYEDDELNEAGEVIEDGELDKPDEPKMITYRQSEARKSWSAAFKTTKLLYNEALCVLLGVNPAAADLLDDNLYLIQNENQLFDKTLSHLFFSRYEGFRLSIRFKKKHLNTKEFILWAIEEHFIKQTFNNKGLRKRQRTIETQENVDSIARAIVLYSPNISKSELSTYVSDELEAKHKITLKSSAIRKNYLDTHPIY